MEDFCAVYRECYPRVLAYAASHAGARLAEDITSETFTIAWRKLDDMPANALPWLLGIARNLVRAARRRAAHDELVDAPADDQYAMIELRTALTSLSEADQEVLTLMAWHGLRAAAPRLLQDLAQTKPPTPEVDHDRMERDLARITSLPRPERREWAGAPSFTRRFGPVLVAFAAVVLLALSVLPSDRAERVAGPAPVRPRRRHPGVDGGVPPRRLHRRRRGPAHRRGERGAGIPPSSNDDRIGRGQTIG